MGNESKPDLSGFGQMLENIMLSQKQSVSSGQSMARAVTMMQTISQAQLAYAQAVMRAHSIFMASVWEACMVAPKPETDAPPSKSARMSDSAAP